MNKLWFPHPKESPYEILSTIGPGVSEEKMFENVDGRTDGRGTDAGVTGILIAHLGDFGSGELKMKISSYFPYNCIRDQI